MPVRYLRGFPKSLIWAIFVLFLLAGCSAQTPTLREITETAPVTQPSETTTTQPTMTDTPPPGKAVLISGGMTESAKVNMEQYINRLASESSLVFEERDTLQVNEIGSDWRVVVMPVYDPVISEAVGKFPNLQFVVFSEQELGMAPNLNVIRLRWDRQAFMAGYLSILITPDWRTGGLFPQTDSGSLQAEAFINGGQYFCGICNSILSPIVRFPVTGWVSSNSDASVFQSEVDALMTNILYVMYVAPGSSSPALLDSLAQSNLVLVGSETPAEQLRQRWAATVSLDLTSPLGQIWENVMAGTGGIALDTPVVIGDINEDFYSPGRQRMVEEILQEVEASWIFPLDVPLE